MVLVFEECLLGIGMLSVIIYLVVIEQCNNPLTKEPKLKSAIRIVPEWKDYDEEVKRLQERVAAAENKGDEGDVPTFKGMSNQGKHVHKEL